MGHALVARRGIAQTLSQLVAEGWIPLEDTGGLIDRIMRGNALQFFRKGHGGDATHS